MYLKINAPYLKEKSKSINFLKDLNRKIEDEKSWFRGDLKLDLSFFYQKKLDKLRNTPAAHTLAETWHGIGSCGGREVLFN